MGVFDPITPPASSMARLEITSFTFMFVCVPEPVCQMRRGNSSLKLAVDDLARGALDQRRLFRVQLPERLIHLRRRQLEYAERGDHSQSAWSRR